MGISGELFIIFVLIFANGIFAMSEIAVVSSKRARLQQWANEGSEGAKKALELAKEPAHFLSTIQIGITLVGIVSGALGSVTIAKQLEPMLVQWKVVSPEQAGTVSFILVVMVLTYFSVILGELAPKRIALMAPERIAAVVARPMALLAHVTYPFVVVLSTSTDFVLRALFLKTERTEPPVTEEEIKHLVEQGAQEGVLEKVEQAMVSRVLDFGNRSVTSIMTPRSRIVWLNTDDGMPANIEKMRRSPHSHFPVGRGSLDNLLGTIHIKDLYCGGRGDEVDFSDFIYPPILIPESNDALVVLEMFKETGFHVCFVIDEFGSVLGLVTLNDILGAIVGAIPTKTFPSRLQATRLDDNSWIIDGALPVEAFKEIFHITHLPGDDRGKFSTVAGFVLAYFGRVPSVRESFYWNGLFFEVKDMEGNRIHRILVREEKNTDLPRKEAG